MHVYRECILGENLCRRKFLSAKKKTIAKVSFGKSKVTEIYATEIFAPKVFPKKIFSHIWTDFENRKRARPATHFLTILDTANK